MCYCNFLSCCIASYWVFEVDCKLWAFVFLSCEIQMLLPEGIRRENTKMYEEVEIPPNEPMPIGFEEKPIYISELDEVGATQLIVFCFDSWLEVARYF